MRRHLGWALASVVSLGVGGHGAASAADMAVKARPMVAPIAYSWTGCYVGANAGYGWGSNHAGLVVPGDPGSQAFYVPAIAAGSLPTSIGYDQSGFIGGGQAGCNYQVQNWVFGVEADIDWANVKGSTTINSAAVGGITPGTFAASSNLQWLGTVRGRVGYTPVDRWLVYATGGLAYGASNHQYSAAYPVVTDLFTSSQTDTKYGYVIGAGVEWAFLNNWSAKAEYLYYDLGLSTNVTIPGGRDIAFVAAGTLRPLSNTFSDRGNIVRVGLNYKFNWMPAPLVAKY